MDSKIIKKTQDTLGKAIKKPPLTDKLLSKPPFRFLHDVFTSVIKTTGFMKGLFSDKELNSENIKDRDSKIAFLQKAIDFVSMVTGKSLAVRPQKIVAGSEPEKTNEFLQALAEAIKMKVNNDEYVKNFNKILTEDEEEKIEPEKDREKKKHKSEEKRDKDKEKHRSRDREKDRSRERSHEEGKGDDQDREKDKEKDKDERTKEKRSKRSDEEEDVSVEICQVKGALSSTKDLNASNAGCKADELTSIKTKMTCSSELGAQEIGSWRDNRVQVQTPDADRKRKSISKGRKSKEGSDKKVELKVPEQAVHGSTSHISITQSPSTKVHQVGRAPPPPGQVKGSRSSAIKGPSGTAKRSPRKGTKSAKRTGDQKAGEKAGAVKGKESTKMKNAESKQSVKTDSTNSLKTESIHSITTELSSSPKLLDRGDAGKENQHPSEQTREHENQESPARIPRPTSAKGSRRRREGRIDSDEEDEVFHQKPTRMSDQAVTEEDLPPQVVAARKLQRPPSARPAPPRPKQDGMESEPAMRLGTGNPTNVIVDDGKQSDDDDDDDNFIVEDTTPQPVELDQHLPKQEVEDDTEHGALVKKMLETKKEFEEQPQGLVKKTEIERPSMSDAARRKQREVVKREIEKICSSIQDVTRSANPLGKIMDYVQEDLDSMQKELEKWRAENKEHALEIKRESGITDRSIEPLKAQLAELEQAISDKLDLIAATKSKIIKNDSKIEKLLTSMSKS